MVTQVKIRKKETELNLTMKEYRTLEGIIRMIAQADKSINQFTVLKTYKADDLEIEVHLSRGSKDMEDNDE